ncbi:hypothetical protein Hdeb2414_s0019g00541091 [Helianthus debilis subsp. tardiflorus]
MTEMKVRPKEEILKEKTEREIFFAGCRIDKMHEEYEEAVSNKRWDKKKECYVNKNGEPVVHKKDIVHDEVLAVIPLSGEYYSNVEKDKTYLKKLIRNAMTSSLRKMDEERMKKNVEELVVDLKKVAEEVKVEATKEEDVKVAEKEEEEVEEKVIKKKAVSEEQQTEEEMKKEEKEEDKKIDADVERS